MRQFARIETFRDWLAAGVALPGENPDGVGSVVFDRQGRTCLGREDIERAVAEDAFPLTVIPGEQVQDALGMALARIAVLDRWCGLDTESAYLRERAERNLEIQARAWEAQRNHVLARMQGGQSHPKPARHA